MKYQFSTIELKDINGSVIKDSKLHNLLAEGVFYHITDLDLVEKAMKINKGVEVELDKVEIDKLKEFIRTEKCTLAAFAKKALIDYMDNVKKEEEEKEKIEEEKQAKKKK